jgi:hypothetical protein
VHRTSFWRGDVLADLPGLSVPAQLFVLTVVLTLVTRRDPPGNPG